MKRFVILALVCLLLCGCTVQPQPGETTLPTETQPPVDPTEPAGCYEPESTVELRYQGAVRAYSLPMESCQYVAAMGEDVVVFSGTESTTITLLSGENLYVTATIQLDQPISPRDASTQISASGISYYSPETREVVLLDTALKEVARIDLPEDLMGLPVLSRNRQSVYYCTADSVRVLDLETGIRRLLREVSAPAQTAEDLLLDDSILRCSLTQEDGTVRTLFLSTQTGELVGEYVGQLDVVSQGDTYYCRFYDGSMQALVYGQAGAEEKMLIPEHFDSTCWYLPQNHAAVTAASVDGEWILEYYDLSEGLRTSVLELTAPVSQLLSSQIPGIRCVFAGEANFVYVLLGDDTGSTLYRWDTAALATNGADIYTGPRYTLDNPDTEGLAACRAYAQELNQRYGVEILLGTEATASQPENYILEPEYQVPVIYRDLELLEKLLAVYPEDFLKQTVDSTPSGVLRICLVREITGTPESGNQETVDGTQFWVAESPYMALRIGSISEQTLYHQIFHVMETKIYSDSQIYYEWDKLNPDGFAYDYEYRTYRTREDSEYLQGDSRAFIDSFAMTFPKEDRARIMEYAMTDGNAECFQSETMQKKLYQLCLGIRKAYGLTESEEVYLWEQYLTDTLAATPKS